MTDFADARKRLPELSNLDDAQFINVVHQVYYPDMDKAAMAAKLGYQPPAAAQPQAGVLRTAGDVGIKVAQGAVDLGAAAVGLGSLATGGAIGKGMRAIGYDPQRTNEALGEYLSDSQKASDAKVAQADGFVDTVATSLQNPRSIVGAVARSAPGMVAGMGATGAVANAMRVKAALATAEGAAASAAELAAGRSAAAAAQAALKTQAGAQAGTQAVEAASGRLMAYGAATEGAQTAGTIADQAQAAGRDYLDYAPAALAGGVGTAAIGVGAGKLMGDAATDIATGAHRAGIQGNMATRVAKSALSEGVLEEMPQSAQEQVFTNAAMGDDLAQGVGNAAGAGLVTGAAMGAGLGAIQRGQAPATPVVLPNTGPLSQAANAGQAAAAAQAAAKAPAAPVEAAPQGPSLAEIDARMAELVAIGRGQLEQRVRSADGVQVVPAVPGRPLTQEERAEYDQLKVARKERTAIPPDQQAEYQALLAQEQAEQNAKFQPAIAAAAQVRDEQETRQIAAMVAEEEQRAREQAEAEEAARLARINDRVERGNARRAAANREALRNDILRDPEIANKQEAFQAALARAGYRDTALTDVDLAAFAQEVERREQHRQIDAIVAGQRQALRRDIVNDPAILDKAQAFQAALKRAGYQDTALTAEDQADFQAAAPLPSAPNELVDAVPERSAAPAPAGDTNIAAVDAAIAAGMRLKTASGRVLHKRGSGKLFTLSTAQKAYYDQKMAELAAAPAVPVEDAAPAAAAPLVAEAAETVVMGETTAEQEKAPEVWEKTPEIGTNGQESATNMPESAPAPAVPQSSIQATPDDEHDPMYQEAVEIVKQSQRASISLVQRHLRIGYNRAARLLERMEADRLVSPMASNGARTVLTQHTALDAGAHAAATSPHNDLPEPSQAQKDAGNYKVGRGRLHGLELSIENPTGSTRSGIDRDGTPWQATMQHHYGYIRGTVGADKDHIDTFVGPDQDSNNVFVVDQVHPDTGKFDEHKVMLGFNTLDEARAAYQANYAPGWQGAGNVTETDIDGFKAWLASGKTKRPFAKLPVRQAVAATQETVASPSVAQSTEATPPAAAAPTLDEAAQTGRRQDLNRHSVKTMSDAELVEAHGVLSAARRPKIEKEIALRGLALPTAAEAPAPVRRAWAPPADVKTYTTKDAQAEWDRAPAGLRNVLLARIEQRNAPFATQKWADMAPADRRQVHTALNEDFYGPGWYVNQEGKRIAAYPSQAVQKSAEQLADEAAAQRWEAMPFPARHRLLLQHHVGQDAEQGKFSTWLNLAPPLRQAMTPTLTAPEAAPAAAAVKPATKARAKAKAGSGATTLRGDYGVPHIDGYANSDEFPATAGGDTPADGVKAAFLKNASAYLKDVASLLQAQGFVPATDRAGKAIKPVSANPAGPAVSGDVMLAMFHPDLGQGIYATIGASGGGWGVSSTASNITLMARVTNAGDPYVGRQNVWLDPAMNAGALAERLQQMVKQVAERQNSGKLDTNASKKDSNGHRDTGGESAPTLGAVAPAEDSPAQGERGVGRGNAGGGRRGASADRGPDGERVPGARSAGNGPQPVYPADAGTGTGGRLGSAGAGRDGSAVPGQDAGHGVTPAAPIASHLPAVNFRITDDVRLGQGGEVQKFNDNLAAIRALRTIEAEQRRATAQEQAILARYVGWGGLANAFPSPETGAFKDAWQARGAALAELLSPKEYALARRSTLDSHYTSQTVVDGMWSLARHLGFKGGLALESSMGVGNFLGRMPQDTANNTKFIGVEYDSLTARIAQRLYPQETVLHSGFQKVPLADGSFDLAIGNPPFGDQSLRFQFKPELNGHSIHNQFFLASLDAVKPGGLLVQVVSRYLLDKQDSSSRAMLAKKARLVGAIRLPDTAFKENARTSVVTDIVILQRLTPEEEARMDDAFDAAGSRPERSAQAEHDRQARAALVPEWVHLTTVPDPLGGDPMRINRYYAAHPHMILGVQERSGSMAHGNDITVRLDDVASLASRLDDAIARLPRDIAVLDQTVIDRAKARHADMSNALRIALAGHENGAITLEAGQLEQVIERETPEGGFELTRRALSPASPWSDSLYMDGAGQWYTIEAVVGEDGKPVKQVKNGKATNLNVYDRKVYASESDIPATMLLGQSRFERLKQLVALRDLLKEQLGLEADNAPDSAIEANRDQLAAAYHAFTKPHGFISEPANAALVANMPDGALVQALEFGYRPAISAARAAKIGEPVRGASATPAPILSKRVIVPYQAPTSAGSLADALAINMAEAGRVDLERIAGLLGKTVSEVEADLAAADKPLLFKDPETGRWETRDSYLSGQVKRKLNAARAARMTQNIVALEAVQPEPWGAENVTVLLGSTWVPPSIYADFVQHISGSAIARVSFSPLTNSYGIAGAATTRANEEEWGSTGYTSVELIEALLNSSPIKVVVYDKDGNARIDQEATALALLKAKAITAEFADWVFKDGARRSQLVELFNEKFNTRVMRQHDGAHLVLPGKVPDAVISMRRHQKNTIWRGISERFMLVDHAVGAGKTYTAIARAMERRRMGLSKKPAIIVPNHMVEQFTSDVYRLYPGAKVLAAGKKDFEKSRRRKLFAKIATGDFDVVIIPHSSFGFIGIAPETEERFLQQELDAALQAVNDAQEEADESGQTGFRKPFGVKEAERLVDKLTARMEKVKGDKGKDRLLTFEQMGIDDLTIDEAHEFKNLFYSSRLTGVKGMGNKTGSQKAFDLYNKVRVLRESPTGSVTFLTGTPISNSAVEMYNMMRYLAADELRELGLEHFDAWRAQFVSTDAGWEPTETGRLKEVNRLGRTWSNMRSLMDLYYSFTDSVDNDDIKRAYAEDNGGAAFPLPRVAGGGRQSVVVQPTKAQIALLEEVLEDFDALPDIKDPYERNKARLRLMDRARKVSLDVRAANPHSASKEVGGKLDVLADNVKQLYDQWQADRGTQLIFLDRSVPKAKGDDALLKDYDALVAAQAQAYKEGNEAAMRAAGEKLERFDPNEMEELRHAQAGGWNAYQQIKDNLIARGIPAAEIRFIQEANNDAQKQALFDAVNDGTVRVLIGSTQRMGAGTNVQQRLVGLHHADVTWKPSDIEQREGRIERQGNLLLQKYGMDDFEVAILAYATERTIDAKMWSLNASKLKTINAIRNYDGAFSMDFEDEDSVSMAELAALASGDPLLLERVKLMAEIDKLELLKRQHARKQWGIVSQIEDAERTVETAPRRIALAEADLASITAGQAAVAAHAAQRSVNVEGKDFQDGTLARQAVMAAVEAQQAGDAKAKVSIRVNGRRLASMEGAMGAVSAAIGDQQPFLMQVGDAELTARTDAARALADSAAAASRTLGDGEAVTRDVGRYLGLPLQATMSHDPDAGYWTSLAVLRADGSTLATGETNLRVNPDYTTSAMRTAVEWLEKTLDPAGLTFAVDNHQRRLAAATAALPELRQRRGGAFPQQGELDAKQDRLEQVIRDLSSGPATAARAIVQRANPWRRADGTYVRQAPLQFSRPAEYFRQADEALPPLPAGENAGADPALALSGAEHVQALKSTTQLNRHLVQHGMAPVKALRAAPNTQFALARQIGKALGIEVNYVSRNGQFDGVAYQGVAYLADGMRNAELAIAGHETLHALEQRNPALGGKLRTQIRAYLKAGVVEERQWREYLASGDEDFSLEQAESEVLADINGAMWIDPQFWAQLAKADRSLFRAVAYRFMEVAAKLVQHLRGKRFDVSRLVSDVEAVRAIMVATWAEHAQGLPAGADLAQAPAFSRPTDGESNDSETQYRAAELQYGGRAAYEALRAAGATLLSYPQWVITKTPNFKQFYGDWEAAHDHTAGNGPVHSGLPTSDDDRGADGGTGTAADGAPAFPGQSGPVRAFGRADDAPAREPAVYFHGTRDDVDAFDLNHPGRKDHGWLGTGIYAISEDWVAEGYAMSKRGAQGQNVMPLFMAVRRPYVASHALKQQLQRLSREQIDAFTDKLKALGHDGVVLHFPDGIQELVAFDPGAVKSAIGNNGDFDRSDARLAFSRATRAGATDTPAFQAWFKDSQVRNAQGEPLVVYHGTNADFAEFKPGETEWTEGIFFTSSADVAGNVYAGGGDRFNADGLRAALGRMSDDEIGAVLERANRTVRHFEYYANFSDPFVGVRDELVSILQNDFDLDEGVGQKVDQVMRLFGVSPRASAPGANVIPAYLSLQNPLIIDAKGDAFDHETQSEWFRQAKQAGHDGLIIQNYEDGGTGFADTYQSAGRHTVYVAFKPEQVKSAVGNRGQFDRDDHRIAFSRAGLADALEGAANRAHDLRLPAGYRLGDLFNQSGKISWWHKTIGTMDNLAKRHRPFARVYTAVQRFLGDVSRYAVVAADQAPTLLPKLEAIRDILGKHRKQAVTAEDTRAISAPIFQGTLSWARDAHGQPVRIDELEADAARMSAQDKARILLAKGVIDDGQHQAWQAMPIGMYEATINRRFTDTQLKAGVVWSDAELRELFRLNDGQIALYREFRAAIDKSLTNLTISEMIKMGGKDSILMEQAIEAPDLAAAAALLRDHYVALARLHPEKADMHLDTAHQVMNLADKGRDLIERGYAPLMRFGQHTVYVQEGDEQVYFGMFESKAEAAKMAREMTQAHPGATVTQGTVSEEAYKLFAGVSPETIELFGSMVGMDDKTSGSGAELYQAYLKMAKANRSAMKRMIHRKGVAGFSEDAGRVLAGFIYSNARLTSGNVHLGEIDEAITEIPKQQGELTDAAMQLRDHIRNPEGGGHVLGGLMFAQFLGGSIASAMVNLTQPFTMTLPYLSQWGGLAKAGSRLAAAVRDAGKGSTGDSGLDAALKWAEAEGIVAPQEVHYLQAQAAGKGALRAGDGTVAGNARAHAGNVLAKVSLGWGKLFAMAELANRRITFIAAYRTAIAQGHHDPALFAQEAVAQTQGTYNSGNKPRWARNTIGSLLMTFKQYSIGYLELLTRMATAGAPGSPERRAGQRAALYMIAVLLLMGGADGLPFEQDIEDAIDGILQRLGYNFSTKRKKQEFLTEILGAGGADFALKGISSLPGMPVDVAGRFGMGNLIPGTGLLTKKASYTRDLGELAGPAGDLAARTFAGAGKLLGGDVAGAALDVSPAAVRNLVKGADMVATGAYRDARGYRVNDTSTAEAVLKMTGFQPNSTAAIQDAKGQALNAIALTRMRSDEIAEHWARGVMENDPQRVDEARAWRDDWNAKNPDTPIKVSMPGVMRRVQAMRQDAANRTLKTAPAALKATVRRELAQTRE